jgi:hypothetical protein
MKNMDVKVMDKTKEICGILAQNFDFYAISFFDNFGQLPRNFEELEEASKFFNPFDKKSAKSAPDPECLRRYNVYFKTWKNQIRSALYDNEPGMFNAKNKNFENNAKTEIGRWVLVYSAIGGCLLRAKSTCEWYNGGISFE